MNPTIADIANAFGMQKTTILRRSIKESWIFEEELQKGGRTKRFIFESLPTDVKSALKKNELNTLLPVPVEIDIPAPTTIAIPLSTDAEKQIALYKADLINLYTQAVTNAPWGSRVQARDEFIHFYNSALVWPHLYEQLGPVSWKTIEGWKVKFERHRNDCFFLVDRRGKHLRGKCGLTDEQTGIYLRCVLRPNKPRLSESYRIATAIMERNGIANTHSEATYRRWALDWKSRHYDIWVWAREGAKAWNDKVAMYIERDYSLLQVGDVIVADGHNLNFEIINPWTGKPQNHMAMILFYDMASNMPLGWEIMPTENTAAISAALRRAVLRLGKYPRVVYLDNGRAFKSRFFKGAPDFDALGFSGLYSRMGCQTIHAWPYHGQSKTVERFFGSFSELERLIPSYTGTSIEEKPARMNRGERAHVKLHQQQFGNRCLTIAEAHKVVAAWFDMYAARQQRGHLDGACPNDIFDAGKGPGVDQMELLWLMMSQEIKHVHRNGITFQGRNYYHPALYGRRHPVQIRYDLQDTSILYVMDGAGELICEATPTAKVHPAASQLGTAGDTKSLQLHIELKKHQEKVSAKSAIALLKTEVLPEHQRQMEQIGVMVDPPQIERKKAEVISIDIDLIRREADEMTKLQREKEAYDFRQSLLQLDESDRYERLIELSAQGVVLDEEWSIFMTMFEQTESYTQFEEYWQSRRIAYGLMHGNQASV